MSDEQAHNKTLMEIVGMICCLIMAVFVIGCLTYGCTRPEEPVQIDHEKQAQRIIENNQMAGCLRAGGSWIPVQRTGNQSDVMSCVKAESLQLVTKMNLRGQE